jgi:hypothetical protein
MRIWVRNTAIFLENLRICDLGTGTLNNLRVCNVQINHYKFVDLRFADWHTLALQIEPKNLGICGLTQKICVPTLDHMELFFFGGGRGFGDLS